MRHLLLVMGALLAIGASPAFGDPIPATVDSAAMFMTPNPGVGDNVAFKFTGVGVDIEGIGGMACFDWCGGDAIPPGTPINLTQIFIANFTKAVVGGVGYDPNSEFGVLDSTSFFDAAGGLSASVKVFAGSGATYSEFVIALPSGGSWALNFIPVTDEHGNATQAFVNGTFSAGTNSPVPEPGTLGLVLVGSAGFWIKSGRRRSSAASQSPDHEKQQ